MNAKDIGYLLTLRYVPKPTLDGVPEFSEVNMTMEHAVSETKRILLAELKKYEGNHGVGIILSGGVDSTTILAMIRECNPQTRLVTYSMGFNQDSDELDDSRIVAEHFETEHHEIMVEDFLRKLPNIIYKTKMPKWNLYPYYLFKACSRLKIITWLSGEGGDELFGGYTFRYEEFLKNNPQTPLEKAKLYLQTNIRDWVPDQEQLFGKKVRFDWNDIYGLFLPYFSNGHSTFNQIFLADYCGKLMNEFTVIDETCAKANNLDIASPVLSREMIQFASKIPHNLKYNARTGLGKLVLREIIRRKGIKDRIISKTKKGFGPNTVEYWKNYGKERAVSLLSDSVLVKKGLLSSKWINSHMNTDDVRYVNKYLGIIALEVYYRLFVTKDMTKNEEL